MVKKISNMFKAPKTSRMTRPAGAGNYDNMDDYNIVRSIELIEGTKQNAPVSPKDLVNKEYVDRKIGFADDAYNIVLTDADTEYSQLLNTGTNRVRFKARVDLSAEPLASGSYSDIDIRWAWEAGKVATPTAPYFTLHYEEEYNISDIYLTNVTIYFASPGAGTIVELETWE